MSTPLPESLRFLDRFSVPIIHLVDFNLTHWKTSVQGLCRSPVVNADSPTGGERTLWDLTKTLTDMKSSSSSISREDGGVRGKSTHTRTHTWVSVSEREVGSPGAGPNTGDSEVTRRRGLWTDGEGLGRRVFSSETSRNDRETGEDKETDSQDLEVYPSVRGTPQWGRGDFFPVMSSCCSFPKPSNPKGPVVRPSLAQVLRSDTRPRTARWSGQEGGKGPF